MFTSMLLTVAAQSTVPRGVDFPNFRPVLDE